MPSKTAKHHWLVKAALAVLGMSAFVGAIAFVIHLVVFYFAFRSGAATPTGSQIYRIASHSDSAYVTYAVHEIIKLLEITMVVGLGIGVPGGLGLTAWMNRKSAKMHRMESPDTRNT